MRRHELSDEGWRLVAPLLPRQARGGRWNDHRTTLSGMLWILRTGAPWRDLPERFGRWQSVYDRFSRCRRDGTFARVAKALCICLDQQGKIDWDLWRIDGPSVRAARSAAGASKGVRTNRERLPSEAAGDNGDSYPRVRLWMARRGSHPVMPQRGDQAMRDGDLGLAPTGPSSLVLAAGRPCGRASPSLWIDQPDAVLLRHGRHCLRDYQLGVSGIRAPTQLIVIQVLPMR